MTRRRHSYIALYPSDWLSGTANMTPMQRLVYHEVCLYLWDHATDCPLDALDSRLRDVEGWRDIVEQLVADGKLVRLRNGKISNPRAILEAKKSLRTWQAKSRGGKTKAKLMREQQRLQAQNVHVESTVESTVESGVDSLSHLRTRTITRKKENQTSLPSTSSARASNEISNSNGRLGNGAGDRGLGNGSVTIADPDERLARFQQKLVPALGANPWEILAAATDDTNPLHHEALARCRHAAALLGKGWPTNWPTKIRYGS